MFKNLTKVFALAIVMIGFSLSSNAQSTATSGSTTASATIVAPIAISAGSEMKFGNIVKSAAGGTVVLTTTDTRTASGVSFAPSATGNPAASSFTVTGEPNYTYAITLPGDNAVTLAGPTGSTAMSVTAFTSSLGATGTLSSSGSQTLKVGATLNVGANQAVGAYSGTYTVTVDYN